MKLGKGSSQNLIDVVWQGGRDNLGWIRQLVTFTESQPVFTSEPRSSGVDYDSGAGFERTVFPSLNPSRREDVALLEQWMLAMMDQITAALPKHLRSDPNKVHSPFLALLILPKAAQRGLLIMSGMIGFGLTS